MLRAGAQSVGGGGRGEGGRVAARALWQKRRAARQTGGLKDCGPVLRRGASHAALPEGQVRLLDVGSIGVGGADFKVVNLRGEWTIICTWRTAVREGKRGGGGKENVGIADMGGGRGEVPARSNFGHGIQSADGRC